MKIFGCVVCDNGDCIEMLQIMHFSVLKSTHYFQQMDAYDQSCALITYTYLSLI